MLERLEGWREEAERRRAELSRALESGDVGDPITGTIFTIAFLKAVVISAAVSIGTSLLTRALTPRQKFTTGQLQGTLQVPQSDQGLPVVEGYGGDPASKASAFQNSHAYALEDRAVSGGYVYVVTTAGTSAGSAPTFPTAKGATVNSNTVTFTNIGRSGGGFRLPMQIVWTSGIRKHVTKKKVSGGGKGPKPAEQTEITYDLDLAVMPGRGPLRVKRIKANTDVIYQNFYSGPTGVPDPGIPSDDPYNPNAPHSPNVPYERPTERYSGTLTEDVTGTRSGTLLAGAYSGVSIYPGNDDQLPDPTMQAAVDALYGSDSTPAFWNRCLVVLSNFYLTKYGGAIPLISTLAEHESLDTLELIFEHFCERVGVLESTDYDFSGVRRVFVRGFPVTPPYSPADVMEELARVFNVYFYEGDKIYARVRGSQAAVAALTSANIGWVDGDSDDEEQELPSLDWDIPVETEIARRYEITAVDPDRDFEQNSQGTSRQITSSEKTEKIELAITLFPEEMREVTQRELYEEEIHSTKHTLSLDWTFLWLTPGDSFTVAEDDGTTVRIFAESVRPNVGVIPIEGSAEELAVYSQPVSTSGGGVFEVPPVPIPGQTLVGFYDGPLLRDAENSINNGAGVYAWAYKRRGDGDFTGSALYVDRGLDPELLETFDKEATAGRCVTALTSSTSVHQMVADALTVDLHNEDDTLESFTADDLWNGAGACIAGDEVCQILEAEREPDTATYPNRWYLTIGLRARRGTDFAIDTHVVGERFVLVDNAVKFVPLNVTEQNVERTYKMVTSGQSYDDAAEVDYTWAGGAVKRLAPVNARRLDDSAGNSLIECSPRMRMGHGLHGGLSGFEDRDAQKFEFEFTDSSFAPLVPPFVVRHTAGEPQKAVLESFGTDSGWSGKFTGISGNGFSASGSVVTRHARALQVITETNNFAEALLKIPSADADATLGIISTAKDWKTETADFRISVGRGGGGGSSLEIYDGSTLIYTEDASAYSATGVRVRIELVGSRVRFFKNYAGPGSEPLVESYTTVDFPAYVTGGLSIGSSGSASITGVMLSTFPDPKVTVTTAQKTQYGIGSTVYVSITELDRRSGRGYPLQVALENSL